MTDITKVFNDPRQASKWRKEAARVAALLKANIDTLPTKNDQRIKFGCVFDDALVTVEMDKGLIRQSSQEELANAIYEKVAQSCQPGQAGPQPEGAGNVET